MEEIESKYINSKSLGSDEEYKAAVRNVSTLGGIRLTKEDLINIETLRLYYANIFVTPNNNGLVTGLVNARLEEIEQVDPEKLKHMRNLVTEVIMNDSSDQSTIFAKKSK